MHWGDRNAAPAGPPLVMEHVDCGGELTEKLTCSRCGADLAAGDVFTRPGPGAEPELANL